MGKFVVLSIDEGSFEQGFPVSLGIGEDNGPTSHKEKVTLSPAPDIPRLYQEWQNSYRDLGEFIRNRKINVEDVQTTSYSAIDDENNARYKFERYLRQWFDQLAWEKLQVKIEARTQPDESIRVIIDTQNIYLKKLPWHLWQLFRNRPQAEFALRAEYAPPSQPLKRPVKILAIFGGSEGLDLTSDRELMTQLESRGAKITWLEQPEKKQLSQSLWKQHWDILFFAGHSSSGDECKTGQIQINDSESISLSKLRHSLNTAVKNGLRLAILNSCDGLGLADELIGIKVPQMIVMREPVPDEVARHFLEYFLEDFSKGHSLYLAVRNARQRLEWMEDDFPCASWLPVICQNPAANPLVWPDSSVKRVKKLVLGGIAIALVIIAGKIYSNLVVNNYNSPSTLISQPIPNTSTTKNSAETLQDLGDRFSWGEKILISSNSNQWKEKGKNAFAQKNYQDSIEYFSNSLKQNKNDPETLIYLNNAVAMKPMESDKLPVSSGESRTRCFIQDPNPLKIAVIAPSFPNTSNQINEEILRGVAQAQNEINSDCGIAGRQLQIVLVDDNDASNTSLQVAKKLTEEKDILAVVGHYSSDATLKAGEVYQKKQMVAVSPSSTAVRKSNNKDYGMKLNKYVFRTPTNDEIAVKNLVNYIVKIGKKKATIVYGSDSTVYSKNFHNEFKSQLQSRQVELINFEECNLFNNANLNKCVEKAKEAVSVMVIVPTSKSFEKALQILEIGKDSNLIFLGGDTMYRERVKQKARNIVVAVPWFQNENEDNQTRFENNAQQLWNAQVNWRTAMSYDATMAIVEGLKQIGRNPTRQGLQQVLSSQNFSAPGAAGKIEFDRNGDRQITSEKDAEIGVLVRVKCENSKSENCQFVKIPQQ